jgi:anti-sigma28 factor (negative regulator of flagellin synthesis)
MRINDSTSLGSSVPAQTGRASQTQSTTSGTNNGTSRSTSSSGDSVEISGFTGRISQALQVAGSSRADMVSRLTMEVRSGTYQVDATAVSKAMVDRAISGSDIQ